MLKGESPEEVFIAQTLSIKVYIDEDNVAMWRLCKIRDGQQMCSIPQVLSLGSVMEVVCEKLPWLYRFAVMYVKIDGHAYAKQGRYTGDEVWWGEEVTEEPSYIIGEWTNMN